MQHAPRGGAELLLSGASARPLARPPTCLHTATACRVAKREAAHTGPAAPELAFLYPTLPSCPSSSFSVNVSPLSRPRSAQSKAACCRCPCRPPSPNAFPSLLARSSARTLDRCLPRLARLPSDTDGANEQQRALLAVLRYGTRDTTAHERAHAARRSRTARASYVKVCRATSLRPRHGGAPCNP